MVISKRRARGATKAAFVHFLGSICVASVAALLVLWVWYPHPYGLLSGGRHLFLLLMGVDVVCGPLLTLVLFNPTKPRSELLTDMALVVCIQLAALAYGLYTAQEARPLFLVHEVDRFRVVTAGDYGDVDVRDAIGVTDRRNGATDVRRNGASNRWVKRRPEGVKTGSILQPFAGWL